MRDFAAALPFARDVKEMLRLCRGPLSNRIFALCHHRSVVSLSDGDYQPSGCNLRIRFCQSFQRARAFVICEILQGKRLVRVSLANVLVNPVVSYKSPAGGAVPLRIKELAI